MIKIINTFIINYCFMQTLNQPKCNKTINTISKKHNAYNEV